MDNSSEKKERKLKLREVGKMLTDLRKKPLSKDIFKIIEESHKISTEEQQKEKKVAKPLPDLEP